MSRLGQALIKALTECVEAEMKTSSAKAKGRRAAQELKDALLEWAPDLTSDDIIVTSSGDTGEDLKLSPRAREVYPYVFECKNVEKLNVHEAYDQAVSHWQSRGSKSEEFPILAFKRNNTPMKVVVSLEHYLKLTR
jgi:hypothetical protein